MTSRQPANLSQSTTSAQLIRPHISHIVAASVDGHSASTCSENTAQRLASSFTHPVDQQHLRCTVAPSDVVFIGARSLEAERGAFRVASLRDDASEPAWVLFTKSGCLNFGHPFWKQKGFVRYVVTVEDKNELKISEQIIADSKVVFLRGSFSEVMSYFARHKMTKAALIGGAELAGIFWQNDSVDVLHLTVCPIVVGNAAAPGVIDQGAKPGPNSGAQWGGTKLGAKKLQLLHSKIESGFVFLEYSIARD